jgi:hypothetical protein
MLKPHAPLGKHKRRFGGPNDGGYVLIDDFSGIDHALSFGIDHNASWDLDLARRGIPVTQYDHTIDRSPSEHPRIAFVRKKIVPSEVGDETSTVEAALQSAGIYHPASAIWKIDIEGDEWPVLGACDPTSLASFAQIVVEFHYFSNASNRAWLEAARETLRKITQRFAVIHVHGNNFGQFTVVTNVAFPQVLEVSFASRSRYEFGETDEVFPTSIDQPNDPRFPDLFLGSFRF